MKFMDSITSTGPAGPTAKITQVYHRIWWDKEGPGFAAFKSAEGVTSGAGLIKPLEAFARQKGVRILMEHKMTGVIREGGTTGKVLGVQVMAGKKKMNFRAKKAVILGSGGWKGQKFLRKLYDGRMTDDLEDSGAPFINSDGMSSNRSALPGFSENHQVREFAKLPLICFYKPVFFHFFFRFQSPIT